MAAKVPTRVVKEEAVAMGEMAEGKVGVATGAMGVGEGG